MKRARRAVLALALLSAAGCAGMGAGGWEDILGGTGGRAGRAGTGGSVRGEIGRVDTRRQEIELSSSFGGRTRLYYDSRTRVAYRGQRYSVNSLRSGDRVAVLVEQSRRGDRYARQINVEQTARDRDGGRSGQAANGRFDGQAGWVDHDRGRFELRTSRGDYTVSLRYNADRSTVDRFRRLRAGSRVRIQGRLLGNARIELDRFL